MLSVNVIISDVIILVNMLCYQFYVVALLFTPVKNVMHSKFSNFFVTLTASLTNVVRGFNPIACSLSSYNNVSLLVVFSPSSASSLKGMVVFRTEDAGFILRLS